MFPNFRLLLSLLTSISIESTTGIEFDYNEEKQPLVLVIPNNGEYFFALPPDIDPNHPNKLAFEYEDHLIVSACPASDQEQYEQGILIINDENDVKTCEKRFKPITMRGKITSCGTDKKGNHYKVGYKVLYYVDDSSSENDEGTLQDIWLYDLCHSETRGTLFTMHELHPGKNLKSFESWKKDKEDYKIKSEFSIKQASDTSIEGTSNRLEIQLVSFDDMTAMPWKTTTLFDFNFHPSNEQISMSLEKINQFLREYATYNWMHLDLFSGVKNISTQIQNHGTSSNHAVNYYWKVVKYGTEGIALVLVDQKSKSYEYTPLCKSICNQAKLQELEKDIPNLLCCEVTESLTEMFDIILHSDSESFKLHLKIEKVLEFSVYEIDFNVLNLGKYFYHSLMNLFTRKRHSD